MPFDQLLGVANVLLLARADAKRLADGYFARCPFASQHAGILLEPIVDDKLIISAAFRSIVACTWFSLDGGHHHSDREFHRPWPAQIRLRRLHHRSLGTRKLKWCYRLRCGCYDEGARASLT